MTQVSPIYGNKNLIKERTILKIKLSQVVAEGPKGTITYNDIFQMFLFGEEVHFHQMIKPISYIKSGLPVCKPNG